MISSSQRPLPDNTQHSQHAPGGIRIHDLRRRAAADLRLRARGHGDRQLPTLFVAKMILRVPVRNVAASPLKSEGRYNPISCGDSYRLIELQQ